MPAPSSYMLMKKIFYLPVLFFLVFGAVVPAAAAPFHDPPEQDAQFACVDIYPTNSCPDHDPHPGPFTGVSITSGYNGSGGTQSAVQPEIVCPEENPECYNDYDLYFYITMAFAWSSLPGQLSDTVYETIRIEWFDNDILFCEHCTYSGSGTDILVPCGSGSGDSCQDVLYGKISAGHIGGTELNFQQLVGAVNSPDYLESHIQVYVSLHPANCNNYFNISPDTFYIDPTIETPLGPTGDPADQQIYATETGELYSVEIGGGPWNDGTDDRNDVVYSWDGETWFVFGQGTTLCTEQGVGGDAIKVIMEAESDTFYIRVNDTEGNFADNTNNPDPMHYIIGKAQLAAVPCEDQFMYDPDTDLISAVTVPGDAEPGVLGSDALTTTEWYAIVVTSGTWQDEGAPPDRTDMQFKMDGDPAEIIDTDFRVLGGASSGVWCQSTDQTTWYVQAQNTTMYLRVNNETGDFTANTGSLSVSIYHATFTRPLEQCEGQFEIFGSPVHDDVDANLSNGRQFVYASDFQDQANPGGGITGGHTQPTASLVAGAWYALDTTDGPWQSSGGLAPAGFGHYDMAVNSGAGWGPLEDWDVPVCNVKLDALGHRRVYFQIPNEGADWRMRVNDDLDFSDNTGSEGWDIYKVISDIGNIGGGNPWESCTENFQMTSITDDLSIPVKLEEGIYIGPSHLGIITTDWNPIPRPGQVVAEDALAVGDTYAVSILGGPWDDGDTDTEHYDAAVSADNGTTWYSFSDQDNPNINCAQADQSRHYWTIVFTVQEDQRWKIRVDDEAGQFTNNGGSLQYHMWVLTQAGEIGGKPGDTVHDGRTGACALVNTLPQWPGVAVPDTPSEIVSLDTLNYLGGILVESVKSVATYIGDWLDYASFGIRVFMAWCPHNTEGIIALMSKFAEREPIATINEFLQIMQNIKDRLNGYNWDSPTDTSLFTVQGRKDLDKMIRDRFFPNNSTAVNPWNGGNVISFSNHSTPTYFSTCSTVFTSYLPSRLKTGVCFAFAYARESGLSFIMQLFLDIAAVTLLWTSIKGSAQEVIYMMTGVKPWQKSGGAASADRLLSYLEQRDREGDAATRELERQFGGRFRRNKDGTYGR